MQIDPKGLKAATKQVVLAMQMNDYGHTNSDGDFITTPTKIGLLEQTAGKAAEAAISAYLAAVGEPVAWHLPTAEEVAELVRSARGDRSIRSFARQVGISPATLFRIEAGHEADMKTLRAISEHVPAPPGGGR